MKTHKRDSRGRFTLRWFRRQIRLIGQWVGWTIQLALRATVLWGAAVAVGALLWGIYVSRGIATQPEATAPNLARDR